MHVSLQPSNKMTISVSAYANVVVVDALWGFTGETEATKRSMPSGTLHAIAILNSVARLATTHR